MTTTRTSRPRQQRAAEPGRKNSEPDDTGNRSARPNARGIALLAATGLVGLALAIHGWAGRGGATLPGLAGSGRTVHASTKPARTGYGAPAGSNGTAPQAGPTAPQAGPTAPQANPSAKTSVGPPLASQSFAQYAFQVWPGTPSATAKAAMTGLSISVRTVAGGIRVTAGVAGQPATAQFYAGGTKVYVVEASMGDDSGNTDYNLGDDGAIVTNAAGRILQ
jgi:hypothetical protein